MSHRASNEYSHGRFGYPIAALEQMSLEDHTQIVVQQALSPSAGRALREWLAIMLVKNDKRTYTQVLTERLRDFDEGARHNTITARTLVITGDLDRVLAPTGGREIASLIPNASHVELPAVGHLGYAENPSGFNDAVLSFVL